jgi:hypothetical protein
MSSGRLTALVLVALAGVLLVAFVVSGVATSHKSSGRANPGGNTGPGGGAASTTAHLSGPAAAESGVEYWSLNGAMSRPVVLPAADGHSIIVAGGLMQDGSSADGVFRVDPTNGHAAQVGRLTAPLHDAAGVILHGAGYVFGGGSSVPTATAQRLASLGGIGGAAAPAPNAAATPLRSLPQARADHSAVTIGSTAYILGGYDGSAGDSAVLATTDGQSYRNIATLAVPVRYAAVAAAGGLIYVFGGDATSGPNAGHAVSTVQVVDPATHRSAVVGSLPVPLAGAAAANLGGTIYVAGGATPDGAGSGSSHEVSAIYAWSTQASKALYAGSLYTPVAYCGVTVVGSRAWLVGGETAPNQATAAVQMIEPNRLFGVAGRPGAGSPYYGDTLLIADRGNNRLLALSDTGKITWQYPGPGMPAPPGGFYFPDDAFFTNHGTEIISNQEENDTIVRIGYPSGKLVWQYGHPRQPGSLPGYLDNPDDAYVMRNGNIAVADPKNCRALIISPRKKILLQIGHPGSCVHRPPGYVGSPNGDTPLADGNLLVSEINGSWIDEYTQTGRLVWTTHLGIGYPSDPQQIGPDRYLVADYESPGGFVEFDHTGHILYRFMPTSGPGVTNKPSLVELLPSGVLMSNDDYNHRIVAVDPATGAIVWQYGHTGVPGTAPGYLRIPDGFDLLGPHGTYPTHPVTG